MSIVRSVAASALCVIVVACSSESDIAAPVSLSNHRMAAPASPGAHLLSESIAGCTTAGSEANDIGQSGRIAGYIISDCGTGSKKLPVIWQGTLGLPYRLPLPSGVTQAIASAVSSRGYVVGYDVSSNPNQGALYWPKPTLVIAMGSLAGANTFATDVNDAGTVVGYALPFNQIAFSWTVSGGFSILPSMGGGYSKATAITSNGTIFGWDSDPKGNTHAVYWAGGQEFDLGFLPGGVYSAIEGASDNLNAVGQASDSSGYDDAVLWKPGKQLGQIYGPIYFSHAWDVNDSTHIVGSTFFTSLSAWHAFLYTKATGVIPLDDPPGAVSSSTAYGINLCGQIVGTSVYPGFVVHAVTWDNRCSM